MEVGVRVEAETFTTGETRHIASAYLVYVALGDDGRPAAVPRLLVETPEEQRRQAEARAAPRAPPQRGRGHSHAARGGRRGGRSERGRGVIA